MTKVMHSIHRRALTGTLLSEINKLVQAANLRAFTAVFAVLLILSISLPSVGCNSNQLQTAAKASDDIAVSITLAISVKTNLEKQGLLSSAEVLRIDKALLALNKADQTFVAKARTYTSFDASSKKDLAKLFVDITTGIAALQSSVASLTNQQAATAFASIVAALTVASGTLQAILG